MKLSKTVSKKTNTDYCRAYVQTKGNMYKDNDDTRKKTERERQKYLEPKMYEEFKKKKAARAREYSFKKKISEQLQVSTATSTSETTPNMSSAFSAKQTLSRRVHKTERSLSSSPRKKTKFIGLLAKNSTFV